MMVSEKNDINLFAQQIFRNILIVDTKDNFAMSHAADLYIGEPREIPSLLRVLYFSVDFILFIKRCLNFSGASAKTFLDASTLETIFLFQFLFSNVTRPTRILLVAYLQAVIFQCFPFNMGFHYQKSDKKRLKL